MPEAGLVCRRCRTGLSRKGDSWCQFCSCASTLSKLAKTRFAFPAHRAFAEELIYQTVRQVQGVVDLDKQTNSQVTSLSDRLGNANKKLNEVTCSINRSATPKRAPSRPEEADKVKSENKEPAERHEEEPPDFGSAESYEESSEEEIEPKETEVREEVERKEFQPALSGDAAPPEPLLPPRSDKARGHRERSRSRNRGRRGGSKHPQRFRGLQDPAGPFAEPRKRKRKKSGHGAGGSKRKARHHQ